MFSNDVLRLAISGPDQGHLGVVNISSIFNSEMEGVTTMADIQLVHNIFERYIDTASSTVLAVLPANVDVATLEILGLAAELMFMLIAPLAC